MPAVSGSLYNTALNRISTVRGVAGDLLNQAQRMNNTLDARDEQVQAQRVAAEDYDRTTAEGRAAAAEKELKEYKEAFFETTDNLNAEKPARW